MSDLKAGDRVRVNKPEFAGALFWGDAMDIYDGNTLTVRSIGNKDIKDSHGRIMNWFEVVNLNEAPYLDFDPAWLTKIDYFEEKKRIISDGDIKAQRQRLEDAFAATEGNKPVKHDTDKPRMSYVMNGFADALLMVGMVGTKGAEVHGDNTWQNIENPIERYDSALWRHKLEGGTIDPQFDLLHDAHAAWNALAVLQIRLESTLKKS